MLRIQDLGFAYDNESVLESISFEVEKGEVLAVMGESGCGKSTLLRLIYGELPVMYGSIFWNNHEIKGPPFQLLPGAPFMKYLAQDFDLMPFLSVEENIHKFLSVREAETSLKRGEELMLLMELLPFRNKKVRYLSGGQQQRVALARVLAQKPELLLLDEPFSHLDYFRRAALRRNLFEVVKEENITCICATHDYHDVLPFAQKVLVLRDKKMIDFRGTEELFQKPGNAYVASLLGEISSIPVGVVKSYGPAESEVIVYPHELVISKHSGMKTEVLQSYFMGAYYLVRGRLEGGGFVSFNSNTHLEPGHELYLNIALEVLNKRLTGSNTRP